MVYRRKTVPRVFQIVFGKSREGLQSVLASFRDSLLQWRYSIAQVWRIEVLKVQPVILEEFKWLLQAYCLS